MRSILLICFLLLCGCTVRHFSAPMKVIDSEEVTWIISKVMAKWKHQKGRRLKLEHTGVHYDIPGIKSIHLELSSQEILEISPARDLFVDFVEDLLRGLNSNPIISEQFVTYPLTATQLHIEINFESYYGYYSDPFYVGCICMMDGMVRYSAFDMKEEVWPAWYSWHSRVEPYTKTRELSILERAADKEYLDDHTNVCPHYLEEYFKLDECTEEDIHGTM